MAIQGSKQGGKPLSPLWKDMGLNNMKRGFFSQSRLVSKPPEALVPKCGVCKLYEGCNSPKMPPSGKGERKILIVGEAPGKEEDKRNRQFVGATGRFLENVCDEVGLDLRKDCVLTNSLICRPEGNATPTPKQIGYCRPNLLKTIREVNPHTIILLGAPAVKSLIGHLWKENTKEVSRWVGYRIPLQTWNTWVCPTFHPSHIYRARDEDPKYPVLLMKFREHLAAAARKKKRPWKEIPDYKKQITTILDDEQAADEIHKWTKRLLRHGGFLTFDYETTCLKPESRYAAIVSCSICFNGEHTIAFPWYGKAIKAASWMLKSKVPKVAANMKFEERWTVYMLKHRVRMWTHDTMVNAHLLDNREDITSLDFQAFVLLGVPPYNYHIKQFLEAKGTATVSKSLAKNRIKEIDINDLLVYNGLDSLFEYHVAIKQGKFLGRNLETLP